MLEQLSAALHLRGHQVKVALVLTPGDEHDHPLVAALRASNVEVLSVVLGSRAYLAERAAIGRIAREFRADVVHTHGYRSDIVHGFSARSSGMAHVLTLHGFVSGSLRDRFYERMQIGAARRADAVVAVSGPIVDRLARYNIRERVHLVRNAIALPSNILSRDEARTLLRLPSDVPVVGWVGRLSHEKGADQFIEALVLAPPAIHGAIIGDGPERAALEALAKVHGAQERLHFGGSIDRASRFLRAFDVLALTSRTEGTPMTLLEAMAVGTPIAAFAVGGVASMFEGGDVQLCNAGDVRALSAAIVRLTMHGATGMAQAEAAGATLARSYSLEAWIAKHEQVYRSALAAKGQR
ncbi:MAG: glycosyltransferase family 4 protein [Gemmatimonadaceae bacterium]|nr:glycosyltransferase family 4 protein [Gemmatimonadaceae bacterium]